MTKDEALRMALDALENWKHVYSDCWDDFDESVITAIRAKLEQPEQPTAPVQQEPVGQVVSANCEYATVHWLRQTSEVGGVDPKNSRSWPITGDFVYTTPSAASVQEPSIPEGWERRTVIGFDALVEALDYAERKGFMPDYIADAWEGFNYFVDEKHTSPALQRTWVGLTDEDVDYIADEYATLQGAIRAIEAKLKEKNT